MKALILGQGSIGRRHARLLSTLGLEPSTVSLHLPADTSNFHSLKEAWKNVPPDYIVIANKTSEHESALREICELGFRGTLLIEKPLFHRRSEHFIKDDFGFSVSVAYQLRFHPILQRLRSLLANQALVGIHAYVGQYLPDWRKDIPYQNTYSASRSQGGGVLRDLSHELDYITWLAGPATETLGRGGRFSNLEIESDDTYTVLMRTERCASINVEMNYLDRTHQRNATIHTQDHTFHVDFIRQSLQMDSAPPEVFSVEKDLPYLEMHKDRLASRTGAICGFNEGLATVNLIEAIEDSNRKKAWVSML